MSKFYLLLIVLLLFSCKKEYSESSSSSQSFSSYVESEEVDPEEMEISSWEDAEKYNELTGDYPDGIYCAEVQYYNPNTGTRSNYDLNVEVENGDLTVIHWPNSGWLDSSHFYPSSISTGEMSFTSDKGYRYTVTLTDYGGNCYTTSGIRIRSDLEEDEKAVTCPRCGDSKSTYDEYCYSCTRKIRQEKEEEEAKAREEEERRREDEEY
ncbi:hypothetical protein ACK1KB_03995 [Chryseobacterium sp. TY3]